MEVIISRIGLIKPYLKFAKNIKSDYNFKEIILYLGSKRLLNLIIYNKYLQKALQINLKDYKKISGKYKIGKKDGLGKEYKLNTNFLIFEGEYLNGVRNGKGKEYYNDNALKFVGEYLNGVRNGKGKEYYYNGNLEFEGEYLNGKKWNGKNYNINGNIEFKYNNGSGKGK